MSRATIRVLVMSLLALPASAVASESVFSSGVQLLQAGAIALRRGDAAEGIRRTQEALAETLSPRDYASAESNLCAGFVLLASFLEAIEHCDRAEQLDPGNWRIYNNRASALLGRGLVDQAIAEFQRGLAIQPQADLLVKSLGVALERKRQGSSLPIWRELDRREKDWREQDGRERDI